ncbi:type II toxin-antitoxin system PemK/MazF family toxin [uncultured Metabacillus sp.]|uniref:type II toxin-antitoxin system PemK/MazF family toxin n=1 Tax=uncultured Metabacillus sp. TaxID=2860135 RepID=UPI00345B38F0
MPDNTGVSGKRPFLVLSNDQSNNNSVIVAPLRSINSPIATHINMTGDLYPFKDGSVLLDQITTINGEFLEGKFVKKRMRNTG